MGTNRSGRRLGMQRKGGHGGGNNKPGRTSPSGADATTPAKPSGSSNSPSGSSNSGGK